jgi:hypothetical protein
VIPITSASKNRYTATRAATPEPDAGTTLQTQHEHDRTRRVRKEILHSKSRNPGGTFTVHAEVHDGDYIWAEVGDCGGSWLTKDKRRDGRGHGLDIVKEIASEWGRDGDPLSGWVVWFRLDWPAALEQS